MVLVSVPVRLRIAAGALFFCIPLVAFEVLVVTRAPWWKLPYSALGGWCLIFSLICFPLFSWIASAKKWAYFLTAGLFWSWILASAGLAIQMQHPSLGFFIFFLLILLSTELFWLKRELQRSFIDPQMSWYEGLPRPIPGLHCQLISGEKCVDLKVSRMDEDGVFVFAQAGKVPPGFSLMMKRKKLDMTFRFRDQQVFCRGAPTTTTCGGAGGGIRFFGNSLDSRKELGDFLSALRGEGYLE